MPTIFSHSIAATALGQWFPQRDPSNPESRFPNPGPRLGRFWIWTVVCAMLPDFDVIGFPLGIQYDDMLGHRGVTHSFAFAALVGLVAAWRFPSAARLPTPGSRIPDPDRVLLFLYFAGITASHGLLDAFTNGGRGIAFLAPFSGHRFFFPWRPIQVSPIGVNFFSLRGLDVLASEVVWILLPSVIIALLARMTRRRA